MTTGITTSGNLIIPTFFADAVNGFLPGMSVMGKTGAVRLEMNLPGGTRAGSPVHVPYFGSLGTMSDYADGDPIDVLQLAQSDETASVVRSGIAFTITDMAQRLAAYADPYSEGGRQVMLAVEQRANEAAVQAAVNTSGLPARMQRDVFSVGSPRYFDLDLMAEARMSFGDEQDGLCALVMHSATVKNILQQKATTGQRLFNIAAQDIERGTITFEGLPPAYVSDLTPVEFSVASAGTSPPTVTITGKSFGENKPKIVIDSTGGGTSRGQATFSYSLDGTSNYEATGVTTAAAVALGDSGLTANFAAGTYNTDQSWVCTPKYSTMLLKRDALIFWMNPLNAEDFRDPLRKATIHSLEILHVTHRYKRLAGRRRGGVALIKHN